VQTRMCIFYVNVERQLIMSSCLPGPSFSSLYNSTHSLPSLFIFHISFLFLFLFLFPALQKTRYYSEQQCIFLFMLVCPASSTWRTTPITFTTNTTPLLTNGLRSPPPPHPRPKPYESKKTESPRVFNTLLDLYTPTLALMPPLRS
jgi:hypothetical protein